MRTLPGRKSVIFFSEGLAIPPAVVAQFRSVIDTANRANVSIYAMDAAGLRTESTSKETRDNINAAAARTLAGIPPPTSAGTAMTAGAREERGQRCAWTRTAVWASSPTTRAAADPQHQRPERRVPRVDEDMRNYYVLTYVPSNDIFDGKFRTIKVNVKRGGVDVAVAQGLLRRARARHAAGADLRGACAGDARRHARAQRISRFARSR